MEKNKMPGTVRSIMDLLIDAQKQTTSVFNTGLRFEKKYAMMRAENFEKVYIPQSRHFDFNNTENIMKKHFLLAGLLTSMLLLDGCAHTISSYSPSFQNLNVLHGLTGRAEKINLGNFTDPKNTRSLMCRLEGPEQLPGNRTYVSYLKNALQSELTQAEFYSPHAKVKLDAILDQMTSDSVMGSAHWTIQMTFNDHIQKPYTVKSTYHYSTNVIADIACTEVAQAFIPATQQFLKTLYGNPYFKKTLHGK